MAGEKSKVFLGSGSVWDPKAEKVIAVFDRKTHALKTDDPRVIELCKKAGFEEVKSGKIPEAPEPKDPLYEPPIKIGMTKKEVKK